MKFKYIVKSYENIKHFIIYTLKYSLIEITNNYFIEANRDDVILDKIKAHIIKFEDLKINKDYESLLLTGEFILRHLVYIIERRRKKKWDRVSKSHKHNYKITATSYIQYLERIIK